MERMSVVPTTLETAASSGGCTGGPRRREKKPRRKAKDGKGALASIGVAGPHDDPTGAGPPPEGNDPVAAAMEELARRKAARRAALAPLPPAPTAAASTGTDPQDAPPSPPGEPEDRLGPGAASDPPGPAPAPSSLDPAAPGQPDRAPADLALRGAPLANLSPAGPSLGLSDRLVSDPFLSTRGSPAGRLAGFCVAALGLLALLVERALSWRQGSALHLEGVLVAALALALVVAGVGLMLVFRWLPKQRRLAFPVWSSQSEAWAGIRAEA